MLNKQQKIALTALFAETWSDGKMVKWEVNNTLSAFTLRGKTITIEKQKIKTSFCYGYSLSNYSSESFDNANRMAEKAENDLHYFITENHKESNYGYTIARMNDSRWKFYARQHYYTGENLYSIGCCRAWENIPEGAFELTEAEKSLVKCEYVKAIQEHHKKIMAYLKRYGLTKVNSWSYWQDA